jgi:glutathione S-transferase
MDSYEAPLPDGPYIMGGELALTDLWIAIIGKNHGSDTIRDDSCLL